MANTTQKLWTLWTDSLSPEARKGQDLFLRPTPPPAMDAAWHVITFEEANEPVVVSLATLPELISYLQGLAKDVNATIVYGIRGLHGASSLSSDMRYFLHPDGRRIELFNRNADIVVHEHGYMGDPPADLSADSITTLSLMRNNVGANQAHADYGDELPLEDPDEFDDDFDAELADDPISTDH